LERREDNDADDDVCVYDKKEMIVYHHPKDVVLSDCFDGGLEREREAEEMRRERSDSVEVMQPSPAHVSSARVRDVHLHHQSGLQKFSTSC
jgi:hypothetical protein